MSKEKLSTSAGVAQNPLLPAGGFVDRKFYKMENVNFDFVVMDKKNVSVSRGGLKKGSYISVNQNDGRVVFTDLMSNKIGIEYGSTATFIFPKENNGEIYILIDAENGFMIRRQGKDRGSLLFMNKIVAFNIHRYFNSEKNSIKLSVFPEQVLINNKMQVWKVICQRTAV